MTTFSASALFSSFGRTLVRLAGRERWNDLLLPFLLAISALALSGIASAQISISHLGTYATGSFNTGAAEIADFDPVNDRIFFVNAQLNQVMALNASNPATPTLAFTISMAAYGAGANSVVVLNGGIAVAVEASPKTSPGKVVFFDLNGGFLSQVTVGALPDMVTVTPDGTKVLCANEGEPDNTYTIDPIGSVSIIDITGGLATLTNANVTTLDFSAFTPAMLPGVRIFGPGATVAQDMEPEYIAVSADSQTAFVGCQENNAVAKINLATNTITQVTALGYSDHNLGGFGIDASDNPVGINISNWPVRGLYMPDAIATYSVGAQTYVVYANEGDAREWGSFVEPRRVGNAAYVLDTTAFPNHATLKQNANLGRLNASIFSGDTDGDGDFDQIYALGSRSFSIRDANGALVFDSGDDFEQITALSHPANFNSNNSANGSFDTRSDDKGPEPEAVALAEINGQHYAFIGLERIGGIMVYNITVPSAPVFVQYLNHRNFSGSASAGTALDLGVESITYVGAAESPTGNAFLITGNEISGTVSTFGICVPPVITSATGNSPICSIDTLLLSATTTGTAPISYLWSGTGTFSPNSTSAAVSVTGAATGPYSVTATNACGNDLENVNVTVNAASTFYADADGDGLGDAAVDSVACTAPAGYVTNSTDNCPAVSGVIGSACDDGNPLTSGDVLNASCVCEGTLGCSANEVELTLNTDANGNETSWEILPQAGGAAVCSGSGLASNSTIVSSCCLPDGCYQLKVYDSFGDGMTTGGYVLRDEDQKRIIDNAGNGAFGSVSAMGNNQVFCVPLGVSALSAQTCDLENLTLSSVLHAQVEAVVSAQYGISNATSGYQYWIFNPNGGFTRRLFLSHASPGSGYPAGTPAAERASYLILSSMSSSAPFIPSFTLLNARVRNRVNGVFGEFGAACRLKIDPSSQCASTKLTTLPTPVISCGAVNVALPGGVLYADAVSGANKYQFQFSRPGYQRKIASGTRSLTLTTWTDLPLQCGLTYDVRVRASFDGGVNYCPFGPTCQISIAPCNALQGSTQHAMVEEEASAAEVQLWPNPNGGDEVNLVVNGLEEGATVAIVTIGDLMGREVSYSTVAVENGTLSTVITLDAGLSKGVYLVGITCGEQHFLERLVIQ